MGAVVQDWQTPRGTGLESPCTTDWPTHADCELCRHSAQRALCELRQVRAGLSGGGHNTRPRRQATGQRGSLSRLRHLRQ